MPWSTRFAEPIPVPKGKPLLTLKDAANYITKLPETEQHHPAWQAAVEALILVAETDGPTMFARIGVMLALNRDHRPTSEPRRKAVKKYEGQFSDCQSFKVVIEPWHASSTQNGAGVRF
jgi:hypothetical protein